MYDCLVDACTSSLQTFETPCWVCFLLESEGTRAGRSKAKISESVGSNFVIIGDTEKGLGFAHAQRRSLHLLNCRALEFPIPSSAGSVSRTQGSSWWRYCKRLQCCEEGCARKPPRENPPTPPFSSREMSAPKSNRTHKPFRLLPGTLVCFATPTPDDFIVRRCVSRFVAAEGRDQKITSQDEQAHEGPLRKKTK